AYAPSRPAVKLEPRPTWTGTSWGRQLQRSVLIIGGEPCWRKWDGIRACPLARAITREFYSRSSTSSRLRRQGWD
ncbi:hypothetical protein FQN49_007862, partial [Arthroderma sp. PD_2]